MAYSQKATEKLLQDFSREKNNPYVFFSRAQEPCQPTHQPKKELKILPHEREALREQRQILFAHDDSMRNLFADDFEAYNQALDNPDIMVHRLTEQMRVLQGEIEEELADMGIADDSWQDDFLDSLEGDEYERQDYEIYDDQEVAMAVLRDDLHEQANKLAQKLFKIGTKIYEEEQRKDADLFRILINAYLVPAKIAYAVSIEGVVCEDCGEIHEMEPIEIELALHGYTLSLAFLNRVRESLTNLINKNFSPLSEWRAAKLSADKLALEIQDRMIELAKRFQ